MIDLCRLRAIQLEFQHLEKSFKKETGLSLNEALGLCNIGKGIAEPGKLARELGISPSRLSRILGSLESRHLLSRGIASDDRRGIALDLTDQGQALVEKLHCTEITVSGHLTGILGDFENPSHTQGGGV